MLQENEVREVERESTGEAATIVVFPDGLVGCPDWRRFALLPGPAGSVVFRLQCLSDPSVCFIVADPRYLQPEYFRAVPTEEMLALGLDRPEDALILCALAVRGEPPIVTANLLAPLVINPRFRIGRQLVLVDSSYSVRHPLAAPAPQADAQLLREAG